MSSVRHPLRKGMRCSATATDRNNGLRISLRFPCEEMLQLFLGGDMAQAATITAYTECVSLLYVIDDYQQCIFMHLSGVMGDWELGTRAQDLWQEPAFQPNFARFVDGSDIVEWRAETSLVRAIASDVRAKRPRKVALVGRAEPVLAGFKMYAESLAGIPAQVFGDIYEAITWLGVQLPEPWPPEQH